MSTCMGVNGKLVAYSHIFSTKNGPIYFMKLYSEKELVNILVNANEHSHWIQDLIHGSVYAISEVKQSVLYHKKGKTLVLETTKNSKLLKLTTNEILEHLNNEDEKMRFQNWSGTISKIIDEDLRVYELDGKILLVLSYLEGIIVDLPSKYTLKIGHYISIFNVHKLEVKDGKNILVCCGRSLIKAGSSPEKHRKLGISEIGIIHYLHKYNLGIYFFYWLWDIQKILLKNLHNGNHCDVIIKREFDGKKGAIVDFLKRLESRKMKIKPNHRSLIQEFLLDDHSCAVLKEFQRPLIPMEVGDLYDGESNETVLWKHSIRNEHNCVLFGVLKMTKQGYITLENKGNSSIYIVILESGQVASLFDKLGSLVAMVNFDLVEEYFNIFDQEEQIEKKKYIMIQSSNILNLVCPPSKIQLNLNYDLKINFKSGLYFKHNDCVNGKDSNGFFVCNASIKYNDRRFGTETWSSLLCFRGNFAKFYPMIMEKTKIKGTLKADKSSILKKSYNFCWLKSFQDHLGTTECVDIPESFHIENIATSRSVLNCSVSDILNSKYSMNEFITIECQVLQRKMMSPNYESEVINISPDIVNKNIGIPGNKILYLLVQDTVDADSKISVYLKNISRWYLQQYPLGVIPGVTVRITMLKQNNSQSHNLYLSNTNFTYINIINGINNESVSDFSARITYLSDIDRLGPKSVVTILATISHIYNISLKWQCPECKTDFRNGSCEYVGCHVSEGAVMAGSAKFAIDDGTAINIVFTKELEHVKFLLNLKSNQWDAVEKYVESQSAPVSLPKNNNSDNPVDEFTSALSSLLNMPHLLRPVILKSRIFRKSVVLHSPDLFLLSIRNLNPNLDWDKIG